MQRNTEEWVNDYKDHAINDHAKLLAGDILSYRGIGDYLKTYFCRFLGEEGPFESSFTKQSRDFRFMFSMDYDGAGKHEPLDRKIEEALAPSTGFNFRFWRAVANGDFLGVVGYLPMIGVNFPIDAITFRILQADWV